MKKTSIILMAVLIISARATAYADSGGVSIGSARFYSDASMIKSLILICDNSVLRYSLLAASDKGLKNIQISSSDKIINFSECNNRKECRISGVVELALLPSQIVNAEAVDSENLSQKEKIKVNPDGKEAKIYLIGSVPGLSGFDSTADSAQMAGIDGNATKTASLSLTNKEPDAYKDNGGKTDIVAPLARGPRLNVKTKKNSENSYTLSVEAQDPYGVDFIEILENGKFLDVTVCHMQEDCSFDKTIKNREPGKSKFLFKTMNRNGSLSFEELTLEFAK